MERSRAIAAVLALVGLCAALLAPAAGAAEPTFFGEELSESPAARPASESILRLTDVPAGFVRDEATQCREPRDKSENEGTYERREHPPPTAEEAFVKKTHPGFCVIGYDRLYRAAGTGATPISVVSFTFATPSAAAAAEGLAIGPGLVEYTLDTGGFRAAGLPNPPIGEEARLFTTNHGRSPGLANLPGTLLIWRQGAMIAGVFALATKAGVSGAAASEYAERQQEHVLAPRPFLGSEVEDTPVYLDNPNIKVPIYWLGPAFGGHGLPLTYFDGAYAGAGRFESLPGRELTVDYTDGPFLSTWTRPGWAEFAKTKLGRSQWSWHCTRSQTLKLPHGHAVIYAAYRKDFATCPQRKPEHFSAHVFLPGVVIALGESTSLYGQGYLGGFESRHGLEAILRALRLYQP
jgi:hypothetical protein